MLQPLAVCSRAFLNGNTLVHNRNAHSGSMLGALICPYELCCWHPIRPHDPRRCRSASRSCCCSEKRAAGVHALVCQAVLPALPLPHQPLQRPQPPSPPQPQHNTYPPLLLLLQLCPLWPARKAGASSRHCHNPTLQGPFVQRLFLQLRQHRGQLLLLGQPRSDTHTWQAMALPGRPCLCVRHYSASACGTRPQYGAIAWRCTAARTTWPAGGSSQAATTI